MVCLRKDLPHKDKYLLILKKNANAILSNKIIMRNVAYINSRLTLIFALNIIAE